MAGVESTWRPVHVLVGPIPGEYAVCHLCLARAVSATMIVHGDGTPDSEHDESMAVIWEMFSVSRSVLIRQPMRLSTHMADEN